MIAQPVQVDNDGAMAALGGEPGLVVELDPPDAREFSFLMLGGRTRQFAH
jgi:hypothetical protein